MKKNRRQAFVCKVSGLFLIPLWLAVLLLERLLKPFSQRKLSFERLAHADMIDICTNFHWEKIKVVTDMEAIKKVIEFIRHHSNGWYTPLAGVPVLGIYFYFFSGNELLGGIGVCPDGLEAFPFYRDLRKGEGAHLYTLVGIENPYIKKL